MNQRSGLARRLLPRSRNIPLFRRAGCSALCSWLLSDETASIRFPQHWWHRIPYTAIAFLLQYSVLSFRLPDKTLSCRPRGERAISAQWTSQQPQNLDLLDVKVWHPPHTLFFFSNLSPDSVPTYWQWQMAFYFLCTVRWLGLTGPPLRYFRSRQNHRRLGVPKWSKFRGNIFPAVFHIVHLKKRWVASL